MTNEHGVVTCTADEWEREGDAITKSGTVQTVRLTTFPRTDVSDVLDAETCATAPYLVAEVVTQKLQEQYPGVAFELPRPRA